MMAGYRPKSLDELNDIYGKTMEAEKAIKKGTSLLQKGEETVAKVFDQTTEDIAFEPKQSEELSDAVSDFIASFATENAAVSFKAEEKPKPQMTVIFQEPVKEEKQQEEETVIPAEAQRQEPVSEKNGVDELMSDYMRIMSDEDDDISEKKLSRKEKKKLKRKEKELKEAQKLPEEIPQEEAAQAEETPVQEELPEETEAADVTADAVNENEEQYEAFSLSDEAEEAAEEDFSFPEDYTPVWMEEEKQEEEITEAPSDEKKSPKGKNTFLQGILSLVLTLLIALGIIATGLKTVAGVNTGKVVADKYYIFTSYKDYPSLSINEGDLVITEKVFAQEGQVFAYIDYNEKTFEFGKHNDTITNDDGEILIVTEKAGGRTLVSRDDSKGVIYKTFPEIGKYVSLLTDNYIVVIAVVAVAALIIFLVLILGLRNKKEKNAAQEETAEEIYEEEEDQGLFATIE